MILKQLTSATIRNTRIWFLGIFQMLLWLLLIAFVFSNGYSGTHDEILPLTSVWYGYIALASFSTLSVVLAATILYSNNSLAYCFRFSLLSPKEYLFDLIGACSILGVILSLIHMVATSIIFSYRFNMILSPVNPIEAIIVSLIAGIFMMNFGVFLALIAINYTGLQSVGILNFIPIMLTIVLGLSQVFTKLPEFLVLFSPFNEIESLLFQGYSNQIPHLQLTDSHTTGLQWQIMILGLIIWIGFFILVNSNLLKNLKPRNIEEARPM